MAKGPCHPKMGLDTPGEGVAAAHHMLKSAELPWLELGHSHQPLKSSRSTVGVRVCGTTTLAADTQLVTQ